MRNNPHEDVIILDSKNGVDLLNSKSLLFEIFSKMPSLVWQQEIY
jgi:hypothetical protein